MLSWFREWSRSIASAALLSLVTLTISSAAPHQDDCYDADCAQALPHDPSRHSLSRPRHPAVSPSIAFSVTGRDWFVLRRRRRRCLRPQSSKRSELHWKSSAPARKPRSRGHRFAARPPLPASR